MDNEIIAMRSLGGSIYFQDPMKNGFCYYLDTNTHTIHELNSVWTADKLIKFGATPIYENETINIGKKQ